MWFVWISLLVLLLVVVAGTFLLARSRRAQGVKLEPPASGGSDLRALVAQQAEDDERVAALQADVAEMANPVTEVEVPPELAAEVDAALAGVEVEEAPSKPSFRDRLARARGALSGYLGSIVSRQGIDDDTWDELEEALIRADVGAALASELLDDLRATVRTDGVTESAVLLDMLKATVRQRLAADDRSLRLDDGMTNVWLFVGVNGVGKTTTIGKLADREVRAGRTVVLAAGDTFRAAAAEQLGTWAERAGATLVRGAEGADPSSVVFDAIEAAAARDVDLVLADTAGRLHTKSNLMEELRKVRRVADKEPGHVTEVLLVLDATTGQNGLVQAREFTEAVEVTGVVLTKLDGSAKGGIVLAIQAQLGIPVKLVGLGETAADLVAFDPDEFVDALFAVD